MKVSVCITVFNEEKSIVKLLNSLFSQTKVPDEIIVVDGGSTDTTIKKLKKINTNKFKIIISKGAGRSKGRNLGVKKARYEIIAMTDADCVCDKYWLKRITDPFENKKTDIVAGFYKMKGKSKFQKSLAPFLGVTSDKISKDFLPSTRSIAFKKSLWKKVGGFYSKNNENTGEDTIFNYEAIKNKANFVIAKYAIVYWEVPNKLKTALKKFFNYAKWDAKSGIWWHPIQKFKTHNIKVLTIFGRYVLFFIFWPLFLIYLGWAYWKAGPWGTIIQVSSDFAIMAGFVSGVWDILNK